MTDAPPPDLPPAPHRALAAPGERRKQTGALQLPKAFGGRKRTEPVRYGESEKKGIAVEF